MLRSFDKRKTPRYNFSKTASFGQKKGVLKVTRRALSARKPLGAARCGPYCNTVAVPYVCVRYLVRWHDAIVLKHIWVRLGSWCFSHVARKDIKTGLKTALKIKKNTGSMIMRKNLDQRIYRIYTFVIEPKGKPDQTKKTDKYKIPLHTIENKNTQTSSNN